MRMVILGAGGLGSVVGGYLARSGVDVTLVGRAAQVEAVNERGMTIQDSDGEFVVRESLTAVTSVDDVAGDVDHFVLAVKSKDAESALAGAGSLVGRIGTACSLQNSIRKDDVLAAALGDGPVIGASITDAGTLIEPGRALHPLSAAVTAYVGERDGSVSPRTQELADAFTSAGLTAKAVSNIAEVEHEKLAQICIAATWATSSLGTFPGTVADAWKTRHGIEQYVTIGKEVLTVHRAMGFEPRDYYAPLAHLRKLDSLSYDDAVDFIGKVAGMLIKSGKEVRPSMHNDLLAGRITEVDEIALPFLDAGDEHGVDVPTLRGAYRVIKTLEAATNAT